MESRAIKIDPFQTGNDHKVDKSVKGRNKNGLKYRQIAVSVFFILALIVGRMAVYINIANTEKQIASLNSSIVELEKSQENLIGKIEAIKKSKKIKEDAMYKLGMVYPTPEQIVYVEVSDNIQEDEMANFEVFQQIKAVFTLFSGSL